MLGDYLRWLDADELPAPAANSAVSVTASDTGKALLCPKTGRLMTKYKIAVDSEHRIDLSPTINAVWMDAGEWELIKEKGLAGHLNRVFTSHWQQDLVARESKEIMIAMYERKYGDFYAELKAFREKVEQLPSKHGAIAYLMADDPYEP